MFRLGALISAGAEDSGVKVAEPVGDMGTAAGRSAPQVGAGRSAQCSESHCCHKYEPGGKYVCGQGEQRQQLPPTASRRTDEQKWSHLRRKEIKQLSEYY